MKTPAPQTQQPASLRIHALKSKPRRCRWPKQVLGRLVGYVILVMLAAWPAVASEIFSDDFETGTTHQWWASTPACDGERVGGACWFLGAPDASCEETCGPHGGYHVATRTFAGSLGSDRGCFAILTRFDLAGPMMTPSDFEGAEGLGCGVGLPSNDLFRVTTPTTASASSLAVSGSFQRACACNDQPRPGPIAYPDSPAMLVRDQPTTPLIPSSSGFAPTWTINPPLPAGLSFDAATGIVTGTPTEARDVMDYLVDVANAGGHRQTLLTLGVEGAPPFDLVYPRTPWTLYQSSPMFNRAPSFGGQVDVFSVSPALPAGVELNPTTGVISGSPLAPGFETLHTVTAGNEFGSVTATIPITVVERIVCPTTFTGLTLGDDGNHFDITPMWFTLPNGVVVAASSEEHGPVGDQNGDGDRFDLVSNWWDPATGVRTNSGWATHALFNIPGAPSLFSTGIFGVGNHVAILVSEHAAAPLGGTGVDFNNDGDTEDRVLYLANTDTGVMTKVTSPMRPDGFDVHFDPLVAGGRFAFLVDESNGDLNGDMDTNDALLHVLEPSTGVVIPTSAEGGQLRAFGERVVLQYFDFSSLDFRLRIYDPATGAIRHDLGQPVFSSFKGYTLSVGDHFFYRGDGSEIWRYDWATDSVTQVADHICQRPLVHTGTHLAFQTCEWFLGTDLNGNGTTDDLFPTAVPLSGGPQIYSPVPSGRSALQRTWLPVVDRFVAFDSSNSGEGVTFWDPATGETRTYPLEVTVFNGGGMLTVGDRLLISQRERDGRDINGDGDFVDDAYGLLDPETDLFIEIPWAYETQNSQHVDFLATSNGSTALLPANWQAEPQLPKTGHYLLKLDVTPNCSAIEIAPIP